VGSAGIGDLKQVGSFDPGAATPTKEFPRHSVDLMTKNIQMHGSKKIH